MERRRFVRVALDARVRLVVQEEVYESQLVDVSLGGALAERPEGWPEGVGEHCDVALEILLAGESERIAMRVRVAHVGDEVVGFESCEVDARSATHLRCMLMFRLGDAMLVDREFQALIEARAT